MKSRYKIVLFVNVRAVNHIGYPLLAYTQVKGSKPSSPSLPITQETFKGSTKEITKEVTDAFNAIYDKIIGLCKKASNYFQYEPLKKEQFTFSKVIDNLGAARKVAEKSETQPSS